MNDSTQNAIVKPETTQFPEIALSSGHPSGPRENAFTRFLRFLGLKKSRWNS